MTDQTPARITVEEFERLAAEKLPVVAQFGIRCERIEAGGSGCACRAATANCCAPAARFTGQP